MNTYARFSLVMIDVFVIFLINIGMVDKNVSMFNTTIIVNIIYIYIILTSLIRKKTHGYFNTIFCIVYYIFLFGRVTLQYVFNYSTDNYADVFARFNLISAYNAVVLALLFFIGIHAGMMLRKGNRYRSKKKDNILKENEVYSDNSEIALIKTSNLVLLVSTIPLIINYIWQFLIELNIQSEPVGMMGHLFTLIGILADMFFICILIQLVLKKKHWVFYVSTVFYASMMTWGGRGKPALIILLLFIIYIKNVKPVKFNLINVLLGYIALSLTSSIFLTIQNLRVFGTSYLINNFFSGFIESITTTNPILEILYEVGVALSPLIQIMEIVPAYIDYQYGSTIIFSAMAGIPGLSKIIPESLSWQANVPAWISKITGTTYGGTMAVDFYINFGYFSIIAAVVIGWFINMISESAYNYEKSKSVTMGRYVFTIALMLPIIWWPRSSLMYFFGYVGRTWFIPLIIYKYYNKKYVSNRQKIIT